MSRKIICGIANCPKCKMLKEMSPETDYIELRPDEILAFARATGINTMPFVIITEPRLEDLR